MSATITDAITDGDPAARAKLAVMVDARHGAGHFADEIATSGDLRALLNSTAPAAYQIALLESGASARSKINSWHNDLRRAIEGLFAKGEDGSWSADLAQVFTDTSGMTPADWGESIARVSGLGRVAIQPSAALRPLLGRAPVNLPRRNSFAFTENLSAGYWDRIALHAAPVDGVTWRLSASEADSSHRLRRPNHVPSQHPFIFSAEVKADTSDKLRLSVRPIGTAPHVDYDLSTGTIFDIDMGGGSGRLEGGTAGIEALGEGWWRVWISAPEGRATHTPDPTLVILDATGRFEYPGAGEAVFLRHLQFEDHGPEGLPSAYQRIGIGDLDIAEPVKAVPSPPFLRFDHADDVLTTPFPEGFAGDVMVFGRHGSWIEHGVTISPGGSLNIGPGAITGTPARILTAMGDIVGWVAVDRALHAEDLARLTRYHKTQGAKGLLVPGPELISNGAGGFSGTNGWLTDDNAILSENGGALSVTSTTVRTSAAASGYAIPTRESARYLAEATLSDTNGNPGLTAGSSNQTSSGTRNLADLLAVGLGTHRFVFTAIGDTSFVRFSNGSISQGAFVTCSSFSVRELRPQEDW